MNVIGDEYIYIYILMHCYSLMPPVHCQHSLESSYLTSINEENIFITFATQSLGEFNF